MRVDWEKDLSASDSIKDGSVYGFCMGVGVRSNGDVPPSRPRSSREIERRTVSLFKIQVEEGGKGSFSYSLNNCFASS